MSNNLSDVIELNQNQLDQLLKFGYNDGHSYSDNELYIVPGVQGCNPNLLINPNFLINQRGKSSYTATAGQYPVPYYYCVDRWRYSVYNGSAANYSPIAGGGIHAVANTGDYPILEQKITDSNLLNSIRNKKVTLTIKLANTSSTHGDCINMALLNGTTSIVNKTIYISDGTSKPFSITGTVPFNCTSLVVRFRNFGPSSCDIIWAKLELGTMFTGYYPPEPVEEFIKCQAYYQVVNNSSSASAYISGMSLSTSYVLNIPINIPFVKTPQIDTVNYYNYTDGYKVSAVHDSNLSLATRLENVGDLSYSYDGKNLNITALASTNLFNMVFLLRYFALDAEDYD